MQGDPGDGKTTLALTATALLSTGRSMPESEGDAVLGCSIYQSSEDNVADTIKPRLIGAGADCSKIAFIDKVHPDISIDCQMLENAITETKARLLVLDPLQAYIGRDADLCRAGDMRYLMGGLASVAERSGCAVLIIGHMNKTEGAKSLYRGLGSIDITASARSVLLVSRSDSDPEVRVMTQIKNSLAPLGRSIAFVIGENAAVCFLGEYDGDDLENVRILEDRKRGAATDLLVSLLSDGARPCAECYEVCAKAGIKSRTVESVKKDIRIRSFRKHNGWYWELGGADGE
jgi:RecA/RadA recombinase